MKLQIRHKLFLILLASNILLGAVLFVSVGWNFSRSFQSYLQQSNSKHLSPLLSGLAIEYCRHDRSWGWLTHNHRQWGVVLRHYLGAVPDEASTTNSPLPPLPRGREAGMPPPGAPEQRQPLDQRQPSVAGQEGPMPLPYYAEHLLLRDSTQRMVMGPSGLSPDEVLWLPVMLDGQAIAQLGVPNQLRLTHELDSLFSERLLNQSAWIVAAVMLLAGLLALPFARRLVRPVTQLQGAMQRLSGGDFENIAPLPVQGHDELAKLAASYNLLADTLRGHLQARQQWVSDISHELRTPVTLLRGEVEALIDGVRPFGPDAAQSLHAEIMRLARLINDLYELSLSDLGALSYQRAPLSLTMLLQELLDSADTELAEHPLQLDFQPGTEDYMLFADADRLLQLFRNLLSNTLRYTCPGGTLRVRLLATGVDTVSVQWEDSAPGVQDADLDHLFERLYRTDSARDRLSGGSGLGLAICQAIVEEAHLGRICARHSALGGLAVHIDLPLYRP